MHFSNKFLALFIVSPALLSTTVALPLVRPDGQWLSIRFDSESEELFKRDSSQSLLTGKIPSQVEPDTRKAGLQKIKERQAAEKAERQARGDAVLQDRAGKNLREIQQQGQTFYVEHEIQQNKAKFKPKWEQALAEARMGSPGPARVG